MRTTILKNLSLTITCMAISTLLVSCSPKSSKNKVSSDNNSYNQNMGPGSPGNDVLQTASSIRCITRTENSGSKYTGQRLSGNYTYHISNPSYSSTSVSGTLVQGPLQTGGTKKVYIGTSPYGDSIVVTKVSNGSQVLGYNIDVYFCEFLSSSQYSQSYPLISNQRPPQNLTLRSKINLDDNPNCGYGSVDAANIFATSPSIQLPSGYPSGNFNFYTSFFRASCNNNSLQPPSSF